MNNNFEHFNESEFEELRKVFYSQAYEILEDIQDSVLRLESGTEDDVTLKDIKRYIHTLKGDSNSFGLTSVGTLCHRIEDILSSLMIGSRQAGHEAVDMLLSCVDIINRLLIENENGTDGGDIKSILGRVDSFLKQYDNSIFPSPVSLPGGERIDVREEPFTEYQQLQLRDALNNGLNVYELEMVFHPMCHEKSVAAFMVVQKLNSSGQIICSFPDIESSSIDSTDRIKLLYSTSLGKEQIERESFITGITAEINIRDLRSSELGVQSSERLKTPNPELRSPNYKSEILRIEASKVDNLMNLVGELIIGRSMVEQAARDIEDGVPMTDISARLFSANSYMERTVSDIQKGVMKMRMVPVNHVFRRFPKTVRELSEERNKKVRLDMYGRETEIDKGIVDALGEPLSHIIRNIIDHGIEEQACRQSIGKPEEGIITLRAYHEASQIVIEISDDGRGIATGQLKKKAAEKGFLKQDEAERLSDIEAINLIFLSGLSTSETVSETSGRGIGMDVVKSSVSAMKGSIEVESAPGKGTKFFLRLPLTLAVIKALLFEAGQKLFAIPISAIAEVTRITMNDLITVNGRDTLRLRDQVISIIHLQEFIRGNTNGNNKKYALILNMGNRNIGLLVDSLSGQQELVIKAVDENYAQSGYITGASILGNGKVVLILDAPALFRKAIEDEKKKMVEV